MTPFSRDPLSESINSLSNAHAALTTGTGSTDDPLVAQNDEDEVERPPTEALVVCLDISESMTRTWKQGEGEGGDQDQDSDEELAEWDAHWEWGHTQGEDGALRS